MAADLTPARCLEVYREVWGGTAAPNTDRGRRIVDEMRAIAAAPDLDAAVAVVAWWWEGDRETEDGDRQRVARARALLRGELLPLTHDVQSERAAVVAYLHAAGYHATAEAIARGEHRETP